MNSQDTRVGIAMAAVTCASLALAGCAKTTPASASIAGMVNYKGAPLSGATIFLYPHNGGPRFQVSVTGNGTFQRAGVPLGEMIVAIETESIKFFEGGPMSLAKAAPRVTEPIQTSIPPVPDGKWIPLKYVKIPARYGDPKTSKLTWTIRPGSQSRVFDLTD